MSSPKVGDTVWAAFMYPPMCCAVVDEWEDRLVVDQPFVGPGCGLMVNVLDVCDSEPEALRKWAEELERELFMVRRRLANLGEKEKET